MIDYSDFLKIDIRVGTIVDAQPFPNAKKPAYQLWVDFGDEVGVKKTSAQITQNYKTTDLIGRQICGVVNFPPKQIANFMSEFLILGLNDSDNNITLIAPDQPVPNGGKLH